MSRKPRPSFDRRRNFTVTLNGRMREHYNAPGYPFIREIAPVEEARVTLTVTPDPSVRRTKPRGLWPPTARTLYYDSRREGKGTYQYTNVVGTKLHTIGIANGLNDLISAVPAFPASLSNQLRTEAIFDAMSKVKDQKWNAGVTLAEANGVVDMVYDFGKLVGETRSLLRKRKFPEAYQRFRKSTNFMSYPKWKRKYKAELEKTQRGRRELKRKGRIPQSWTYYHFGIKPTVNDISDAIDQIGQGAVNSPYDFGGVVTGYAKETRKETIANNRAPYGRAGVMQYDMLMSVRVAIHVHPKPGFLNRLSKFGVSNPPDALYNGLPFSWVADYFSTLGDWINLLDVGLGWQFPDKWSESTRIVRDCKFTYEARGSFRPIKVEPATWKTKSINRVVRGDLYGPMGSVLPTWKRQGPSLQKVSNLLSVTAGLFLGSGLKSPRI